MTEKTFRPEHRAAAEVRIGWYIPLRFKLCTLDRCPTPRAGRCECDGVRHYVPSTRSQREALAAATAWAEQAGRGEGIALALVGPPGTGKSHLMYAAIRHANLRGVNAGAWGWFDLADHLRAAMSERDEQLRKDGADQRARVRAVRAFGLDEIRPTSGTDYDSTQLSNLMTRAYRECQDVFVTSNHVCRPDTDRDPGARYIEDIIGIAATSRLTMVQVDGPDYRQLRPARRPQPQEA